MVYIWVSVWANYNWVDFAGLLRGDLICIICFLRGTVVLNDSSFEKKQHSACCEEAKPYHGPTSTNLEQLQLLLWWKTCICSMHIFRSPSTSTFSLVSSGEMETFWLLSLRPSVAVQLIREGLGFWRAGGDLAGSRSVAAGRRTWPWGIGRMFGKGQFI